jgi:8-oxo-dGTP pyrophosphatase MutT (NUDIX family)
MSESIPPELRATLSTDEARHIETQDPAIYNAGLAALGELTPDDLRARFALERTWKPEMLGDQQFEDMDIHAGKAYRQASVLVPLIVREHVQLLLTQRPTHLKDHPGQISFPGGRAEEADPDAIFTALREAHEELGLDSAHIEVLGTLPKYYTVTRYEVTPVVALVHPPFGLILDPGEVAEAFEVPLSFILDPANHEKRSRPWQGRTRHFYAMPYGRFFIWGATAAMLRNFYHFLRA